jgi:hypothetical protein
VEIVSVQVAGIIFDCPKYSPSIPGLAHANLGRFEFDLSGVDLPLRRLDQYPAVRAAGIAAMPGQLIHPKRTTLPITDDFPYTDWSVAAARRTLCVRGSKGVVMGRFSYEN